VKDKKVVEIKDFSSGNYCILREKMLGSSYFYKTKNGPYTSLHICNGKNTSSNDCKEIPIGSKK
jgi:hypothetical protein